MSIIYNIIPCTATGDQLELKRRKMKLIDDGIKDYKRKYEEYLSLKNKDLSDYYMEKWTHKTQKEIVAEILAREPKRPLSPWPATHDDVKEEKIKLMIS